MNELYYAAFCIGMGIIILLYCYTMTKEDTGKHELLVVKELLRFYTIMDLLSIDKETSTYLLSKHVGYYNLRHLNNKLEKDYKKHSLTLHNQ